MLVGPGSDSIHVVDIGLEQPGRLPDDPIDGNENVDVAQLSPVGRYAVGIVPVVTECGLITPSNFSAEIHYLSSIVVHVCA